jgi:diaminopimelate epimerase
MEFFKMHGAGNDFVLVDARQMADQDWAALSVTICDRHFGAGGDGLLLVLPSQVADFRMRMFNPDGSEAEMCGNGIRCFAKYLFDAKIHLRDDLKAETLAGIRDLRLHVENGSVIQVRVGMGTPILDPGQIPVTANRTPVIDLPIIVDGIELRVTCVSMGNPHAILFIDNDPDEYPLETIGPLVERHPAFPRRVNFEVAQVRSERHIKARVWERGAGITLACGTGACAVAAASRLNRFTGDEVSVDLPGGRLAIEWPGVGELYMTGPAVVVYRGDWPEKSL